MHKHGPLLVRCSHSALRVLVPVVAAVHRVRSVGRSMIHEESRQARWGPLLDFALLAWCSGWCMLDALRVWECR